MADDIVFLKYIIKGIADKLGFKASFMPKPFGDKAGSGLHAHCSLLDGNKKNLFDNGNPDGSDILKNAVAGLIKTMPELTLVMAPHLNSYRRLTMESHAPNAISWGYENRTVAIRIPGGETKSRRIEHRVAGSDVNPYLSIASSLACGYLGMREELEPSAPEDGNAYNLPFKLPRNLSAAMELLEQSEVMPILMGNRFLQVYIAIKTHEYNRYFEVISPWERENLT